MTRWSSKELETSSKPVVEMSSGNVFIDLGYPESEAINITARLELMYAIEQILKERGWTQQEAGRALGIRQPRVSELMKGHSEKFTIDMLIKLLDKLGKKVSLIVEEKEVA